MTGPSTSGPAAPWRSRLDEALADAGDRPEARYVQLATVGPGGRPANRTVVFRGFLDPGDALLFTTDARAGKAGQLALDPWCEVCWYLHESRRQFRLLCRASVNPPAHAGRRAELWSSLSEPTRRSFTWPPPGAPRAPDASFDLPAPVAPPDAFGLLVALPQRVEFLDLRPHPHDRFVYLLDAGAWSAERLNP